MRIAILVLALTLAGCGEGSEPAAEPAATRAPIAPVAQPASALEELNETDLAQADLEGELACTFRRSQEGPPIFFGRGDVLDDAGAVAAVKYDGAVRRLAMARTGGYDAMADGARFEGSGIALTIATTGGGPLAEEPQVAMESPIHRAILTFTAPPGEAERTVEGVFECGP